MKKEVREQYKQSKSRWSRGRHLDDGRVTVGAGSVQVDPELAQCVYGLEEALREQKLVVMMMIVKM